MISICAYLVDTAGVFYLDRLPRDTVVFAGGRRVSRTATLDGGVTITDAGFVDGDRTLNVSLSPFTLAQLETIERLFQLHSLVTVALRDGAYRAVPDDYSVRDGTLRFSLLIKSRVS